MYESSLSDPTDMSRNRRNSRAPRFSAPSAMFAAAEYAARRACEVNEYISSRGHALVIR
jgi:hypothetical protein